MYNNNLDTLDASDQMMLPHIKLPLWFVRKKSTHPYQPSLCAPNPPKKQKKKGQKRPSHSYKTYRVGGSFNNWLPLSFFAKN